MTDSASPPGPPLAFDTNDSDELARRLGLVSRAFSPSSPITSRDLFSGRTAQLNRLIDVCFQRGQHALVYGERGVGKTSLARVVMSMAEAQGHLCAYFTCSTTDVYGTIWQRALDEIHFVTRQVPGFVREPATEVETARSLLPDDPAPHDVRRVLELLSRQKSAVIFIDEFDRPTDSGARTLFADTIKMLSDQGVDATLVLIGVGSAVADLIAEHASIGRSLVQINMPVMNRVESAEIVRSGIKAAELHVEDGFVEEVVRISQGLPHYTHLIAQHGARLCVEDRRLLVCAGDSKEAVALAMEDVSQTVRETYHRATFSNRDTLYAQVLLACALAEKDDIGQFGSADVRLPLRRVTGHAYDIPAYSAHLNAFASMDGPRGGVLRKLGTQARFRYRFIDPLMPPFVLMKAHAAGVAER